MIAHCFHGLRNNLRSGNSQQPNDIFRHENLCVNYSTRHRNIRQLVPSGEVGQMACDSSRWKDKKKKNGACTKCGTQFFLLVFGSHSIYGQRIANCLQIMIYETSDKVKTLDDRRLALGWSTQIIELFVALDSSRDSARQHDTFIYSKLQCNSDIRLEPHSQHHVR